MRYQLSFLPEANDDIDSVLAWTREHFGDDQMVRYGELISLALDELESDPFSPRARSRAELHPDARVLHLSRQGRAASHFFVFRIGDKGTVEIGRLLHESMDLPQHLPEEYRA